MRAREANRDCCQQPFERGPIDAQKQSVSETPNVHAGSRMLRITAAAEYIGASTWFIRTLCWRYKASGNGLPHLIFGKRIVIDRADLDAYIERQKKLCLSRVR
jgi:hypothetical protein